MIDSKLIPDYLQNALQADPNAKKPQPASPPKRSTQARAIKPASRFKKHQALDVLTSARLLAKTRDDLFTSGTAHLIDDNGKGKAWGHGPLGSMADEPLTTVNSGHKPPMLTSLENVAIKNLSQLNSQYKMLPNLLSTAMPRDELLDFNSLIACREIQEDEQERMSPQARTTRLLVGLDETESTEATAPNEQPAAAGAPPAGQSTPQGGFPPPPPPSSDAGRSMLSYRSERLMVFRRTAKLLASSFRTYRPLLAWIFAEHSSYAEFLASMLAERDSAAAKDAETIAGLRRCMAEGDVLHKEELRLKSREVYALKRQLETLASHGARVEATYHSVLKENNELHEVVSDLEEVKSYLQKQVSKLERKVHNDQHGQEDREDATALRQELESTQEQLVAAREGHETAQRQLTALSERHKALEVSAGAMTPRPCWGVGPLVELAAHESTAATAVAAAHQLAQAKQRVLQMENESQKVEQSQVRKFFVGLGPGAAPSFLAHTGKVKNLNVTKDGVERHIKQFWNEKAALPEPAAAEAYFPVFINKKYGASREVSMVHNMWYAAEKYADDPICALFLQVMKGNVDESVWYTETSKLEQLKEMLQQYDAAETGVLDMEDILSCMVAAFPTKPEDRVERLRAALRESRSENGLVLYVNLFEEYDECLLSSFAETLRKQNLVERQLYLDSLSDAIATCGTSEGTVNDTELRAALLQIDPELDPEAIDDAVDRANLPKAARSVGGGGGGGEGGAGIRKREKEKRGKMLPLTVDAVGFAVEFAWAAGESVVVPYLVDHLGVSFSTAALVFAVNPVVAVFLQPALGEFSDRLQTRCSIGGRIPLIVGLCVTSLLGILTLVTAEVLLGGRKVPTAVLAFVGFGVLDVSHDCLLIPARAFISDMTADAPEAEEALHNRFSLAQTLGRALALFAGALPIAKVPLFAGSGEVRTFRGLLSLTGLIIVASGASATFLGIRYLRSSRARQDHQQAELSERLSCAASGDAVSVSESNASIVELTVSAVTAEDCVPLGGVQDATDASEGGGGESEPAAVPSVKEPIDWKVLGTLTLVQCFAWYGFMANNFYWTEWVGLTATLPGTNSVLHTAMTGLMAQALSGCAASWVLPAANRRHGVKKTYIVAMILSSVTLGLSCFAKGWFSVLCLMPMGVAYIVVLTNAQLLCMKAAPPSRMGLVTSIMNATIPVSQIVTATIAGILGAVLSNPLRWLFLSASIAVFIGAVLAARFVVEVESSNEEEASVPPRTVIDEDS
ncbi:Sucrose transport protein SUC4 [Diplonema papillatum]|nr:Sucrose transport protein SUC4 [Diplonema papillatum]